MLKVITPSMRDILDIIGQEPVNDPARYLVQQEIKLKASPTAEKILRALRMSNTTHYLLVTEGLDSMYVDPTQLAGTGINGGIAAINPTNPLMLNGIGRHEIAFIHELGHALQWEKHRDWYIYHTRRGNHNMNGHAQANYLGPENDQRSTYVTETHNMFHHEWPVCNELGYAPRQAYSPPDGRPSDFQHYWPRLPFLNQIGA